MRYFRHLCLLTILLLPSAVDARCNPNGICTACTTCSSCKYCKAGGSCSACRGKAPRSKQSVTLPSQFTARVVGVSDGDTITVLYQERHQVKVRLYGIDAPENSQPFGRASKKKLSDLVFGKNVTLYSKGTDRYQRLLAWVFVGKMNANKEMVTAGLAWWYSRYAPKETGLRDAEQSARARRAGLWADKSPVAPWEWRKR